MFLLTWQYMSMCALGLQLSLGRGGFVEPFVQNKQTHPEPSQLSSHLEECVYSSLKLHA